jgi:hypothetical protein
MGYRKCGSCGKWYNGSENGCTNGGCEAGDRAKIAKLATTPVHPQTKAPIAVKMAPKLDKTTVKSPLPKAEPPKEVQVGALFPALKKVAAPKPVALPDAEGELMASDEMQQLETGHHIIYRGDTRTPSQLKGYGGFSAWVPLTTQQAQDVIKRSTGQNFDIKLPERAKRLEGYFNQQKNINMLTLGRQIKLEKAGDTFHISTDPTEGCGGYSTGYIYAMRFRNLYLIDKQGVASSGSMSSVRGINSLLVLDTTSMASATTIAVAIPGQGGVEIAFLTSIPIASIYKYKTPNGSVWHRMPA